nr:hypothetical protein CFP56_78676 [Quercus suber]
MPSGPPHPAFPTTLLAFYLLSEAELDSMMSYYHQTTPGPWSLEYPCPINWDKDFLAKRSRPSSPLRVAEEDDETQTTATSQQQDQKSLAIAGNGSTSSVTAMVRELQSSTIYGVGLLPSEGICYDELSDIDRIRIKRRKLGKFIGLPGMQTPVREIEARIQSSAERAVARQRRQSRWNDSIVRKGPRYAF